MRSNSNNALLARRTRRCGGPVESAGPQPSRAKSVRDISRSAGAIAAWAVLFISTLASVSAADSLGFTLENNSGDTIVTVNVSPDWKRDWGADQLQGGPIEPGDSRFIAVVQEDRYCYFDVMIRSAAEETHTFWFIDVCANQTVIHSD